MIAPSSDQQDVLDRLAASFPSVRVEPPEVEGGPVTAVCLKNGTYQNGEVSPGMVPVGTCIIDASGDPRWI